jgi:hypothetical protein
MTHDTELSDLEPANDGERIALELSWARGALDRYLGRLLTFVDRNRAEIVQLADGEDPDALVEAAKRVVVRAGHVDLSSEMRDQVQRICDEIWIRGERGDYDRAHITQEWTSLHAANWRRWRIKEYVFVIDRCADEIVARIRGG